MLTKVTLGILFLFFNINSNSQEKEKEFVFFVDLIIKSLPEYRTILFSYTYDNKKCLVVRSEPDFVHPNKTKCDSLNNGQIVCILSAKVIFTFVIEYWLQFKRFEINENKAVFEIKTCSWKKLKKFKYLKGKIVFEKDDKNTWYVKSKNIKKVKFDCVAMEVEKYNY